eukprot:2643334-Rhodomonas_salina.2
MDSKKTLRAEHGRLTVRARLETGDCGVREFSEKRCPTRCHLLPNDRPPPGLCRHMLTIAAVNLWAAAQVARDSEVNNSELASLQHCEIKDENAHSLSNLHRDCVFLRLSSGSASSSSQPPAPLRALFDPMILDMRRCVLGGWGACDKLGGDKGVLYHRRRGHCQAASLMHAHATKAIYSH